MKTPIAIGASGLLGLAILFETGRHYAGVDRLALWVTVAMAAALLLGLAELYGLGRRLERAIAELDGLAKKLSRGSTETLEEDAGGRAENALASASPTLQAWLRARLGGAPGAPPAPVFAPFLTGLLVMLGLLGTFLGLFETLRGAGLALTASADIDALRTGLQTPMQGLMRSFGTSACGVATSAALGAALVFTRRTVGHLDLRLQEVATGPLGHLSADRRQLSALEALAAQGRAWPAAAASLATVSERLDGLRGDWDATHREAAASLGAGLRGVGDQMSALVRDASTDIEGRLKAVEARLQAAMEGVQGAVASGATEAGKQTAAEVRALFEQAVSGAVAAANAQLREVQAGQTEGLHALREGLDGVAEAQREQAATLANQLRAQTTALIEQERTRAAALVEQFEQGLQAALEETATLSAEHQKGAQAAAETLQSLASGLQAAAEGVREQTRASREALDGQQAQSAQVYGALEATAKTAQQATQAQHEAALSLTRDHETRLQAWLEGNQQRVTALIDALQAQAQEQGEQQAGLTKELTAFAHEQLLRLQTHGDEQRVRQEESLSALADLLAEHLRKLDRRLETSTDLLAQTGGLVQAGGAELVTVAETFSAAVEAQRTAAQAWLESLGEIERSVTDAGEAAAADVLGQHLARTHEVFDRQLRFQQELMEQLRRQGREGLAASPVAVDASA